MNYNFGSKSTAAGMYENLPAARSSLRRQVAQMVDDSVGDDVVEGTRRESQPIPPRRRPLLNEAGQSGMLTDINHSPCGTSNTASRKDSTSTHKKHSVEKYNEKMDEKMSLSTGGGADTQSGGVPRFTRARSEKREIVDSGSTTGSSWFLQNFTSAGGCGGQHQNNVNGDMSANQSDTPTPIPGGNSANVHEKRKMFEAVPHTKNSDGGGASFSKLTNQSSATSRFNEPPQPPHRVTSASAYQSNSGRGQSRPVPYRGSKTSPGMVSTVPSSASGDEWDFLARLNEILRRENFLSEQDTDFGNQESNCNDGVGITGTGSFYGGPANSSEAEKVDGKSGSNVSTSSPTAPMSPRPPRPNRMRSERRKEYARTRSLDAGHLGLVSNGLSVASNSNHDFHGINNNLLTGSSIDLPGETSQALELGQAGFGISDSNHPSSSSTTATSCVTVVEDPFQQLASKNLSVLPLTSPQQREHQRQTLVSPVTSPPMNTPGSPHFPPFMNYRSATPPLAYPNSSIQSMPHAGGSMIHNSSGGERCATPRHHQQQQQPNHRLTTDAFNNNGPNNNTITPSSFIQQYHHQPSSSSSSYRITRSPLLNTVSSSLDSIYERLKANEYFDPIGPSRPLTQVYLDRNFGAIADYYGIHPVHHHHGGMGGSGGIVGGCGSGFNLMDVNSSSAGNNNDDGNISGYNTNSQPNLFVSGGVLDRNFYSSPQSGRWTAGFMDTTPGLTTTTGGGNVSNNNNVVSGRGHMSPFQPNQMMMESVSSSPSRFDRGAVHHPHHLQQPHNQQSNLHSGLTRSGMLGGSLSCLIAAPSANLSNNNSITSAGNHSAASFASNPAPQQPGSWWNIPTGDYRGRSYGSFKVILLPYKKDV